VRVLSPRIGVVAVSSVLSFLAACGGATEPPVATVSVTFNHATVPLGAPVEATYRISVAPGATFDRDYRVLVHFVNEDGDLMWTDDHDPPIPTTRWTPGQQIEYRRTTFVPVYPYLGRAAVRVGLYDPASGRRLPLTGKDDGQEAYTVASLDLQPQSESIFVVYGAGWYDTEVAPGNSLDEWRWTSGDAEWSFRNPRRDVTLYLDLDGRPELFDPPQQQVSVKLADRTIETFPIEKPVRALHTVAIPADQLGTDDTVHMSLVVDRTFVPAERSGGEDTRRLGVRIFHLFVEPR
jgi:hypothetical protein